MQIENDDLLRLVNAAGFLFQLRVQQEIESSFLKHQKQIIAREHHWCDPQTGREGFIDLIISTGTNGKMIIECKRVRDANWVFLVPESSQETGLAHILWTSKLNDTRQVAAWDPFVLTPPSLEAEFCIVRGQSQNQQPMLERISDLLLRSTECLAEEEFIYDRPIGKIGLRFYFPVIITTASLHVCRFDPSDVDIVSGELTQPNFHEVPFLRFTKSLSSRISSSTSPHDIAQSAMENRRTVFVVNSRKLDPFLLDKWELTRYPASTQWPWNLSVWNTDVENGNSA